MADHSPKPIESIVAGDRVMALDPVSGNVVAGRVERLVPSVTRNSLMTLSFDTGESLVAVKATRDHRFFVGDYTSLKDAKDLAVGDVVFVWRANQITGATLVRAKEILGPAKVFNFEVEPHHDYFANDVLVHNSKQCFAEGTGITLGNGEKRAIERMRAGDEVLSVDPRTGALVARKVLRTHVFRDRPAVMMVVGTDQGWVTIRSGRTHRFYTADSHTAVAAHRLALGDQLLMRQAGIVTRARLLWSTVYRERGALYDLEVEGSDSYFAEDILVRDAK